jgi:hypothetical protein
MENRNKVFILTITEHDGKTYDVIEVNETLDGAEDDFFIRHPHLNDGVKDIQWRYGIEGKDY